MWHKFSHENGVFCSQRKHRKKTYSGNIDLSTISGEIDLRMLDTSLVAETLYGSIYADEKLKFKSTDCHIGQKVEGSFDKPSNRLRLNTIIGNLYLRLWRSGFKSLRN